MTEPQEASSDPIERARERARKDRDYARGLELLAGLLAEAPRPTDALAGRPVTDVLPSIP